MDTDSYPLRARPAAVTFSVVAPVYNEQESLPCFYRHVDAIMESLGEPFELLRVDDGSTDRTPALLQACARHDPRVLTFSRNFGHQIALSAGLDAARGRAVILMDADLQDPPEVIPRLVEQWRAGGEVVYALRTRRRGESALKRLTASAFYRLLDGITAVPIPRDMGDFRLLDRRVVDVLMTIREHHRFLRGLSAWVGFRQVAVPYERQERFAGTTKFPLRRMLRFSLDAITRFSDLPLRLAALAGACFAEFGLLGLVLAIALGLLGNPLPGEAGLALVVVFLAGIQLICLGILGEYLARVYDEVRNRPLYVLRGSRDSPDDRLRANLSDAQALTGQARERLPAHAGSGPVSG